MTEPMSRGKKRTSIVVAAALVLAGAAAVFAYWTSTGTGTGTATTGESVAFTITTGTAEGLLAPGSDGQVVGFSVANSAEVPQYLEAVTVELADEDGTPWVPTGTCDIADYTATISTAPPAGEIAAGGSVDGFATVTLENTAVNQDDCQGQDVPLYFEAITTP